MYFVNVGAILSFECILVSFFHVCNFAQTKIQENIGIFLDIPCVLNSKSHTLLLRLPHMKGVNSIPTHGEVHWMQPIVIECDSDFR